MRVTRALGFGLVVQAQLWSAVVAVTPVCQTDILPESVPQMTRSLWCTAQINSCGTLCNGETEENTCDVSAFCYSCICSDLSTPDLASYTRTIPTFLCDQHYQDCIDASGNDPAALQACREYEAENCGHNDPDTIIPSNPIAILPLSTSTTRSSTPSTSAADPIAITSETATLTPSQSPTGTTTFLVTSMSTPGQSVGDGQGQGSATVSFVTTTFPASLSTGVPTTTGSSTLSSGSALSSTTRTVPSTVSTNGAGKMGVVRVGEGMWMAGVLAVVVWTGVGLAVR